jgi:hypothetical protein
MKFIRNIVLCGFVAAVTAQCEPHPVNKSPRSKHWAYQTVKRPELPAVQQQSWVRTPIDSFILSKLESKGIKPSPDAERAALIRRATLDAWGIIPTPEEVKAFVDDRSPKPYEKLVDRLLASPRYGERWGRRWLDLTRYADTDGFNNDGVRPNAWRYRDYVIRAFNEDKPYDRFIREQLAGDEIWPDDSDAFVATGFMRNYPDEINSRDLNLKREEILTDITDAVGSVFLATTVTCAKCHNHKFDPISQKEYYQLESFFANAGAFDEVPAFDKEAALDYDRRLNVWKEKTKDIREQLEVLTKPLQAKREADRLLGFVPETIASLTKPESERTPYDRWIIHRAQWTFSRGDDTNGKVALKGAEKEKYDQLKTELKKYDSLKPKDPPYLSGMKDVGPEAPVTHVLAVGVYNRPMKEELQPAFPAAFSTEQPVIVPTATSTGRRTALANWIASPQNPLTARVMVNRIWYQYFGHGIVDTVSDFGLKGARPTNPELLDWLADEFVKQGWSIKKLQREILLSSVYRQSSAPRPDAAGIDPDNKLLSAFPRQRMDAEVIRDSLLSAAGLLENKAGGPGVFPPAPENLGAGKYWKVTADVHEQNRRSAYVFVRRNLPYPLLETFDMASPQFVAEGRDVTTTAPQALTLLNSDLVYQWSGALAARVTREAGSDVQAQLERLYQILYARSPDGWESDTLQSFLFRQEKVIAEQQSGKQIAARDAAFVDLVHALANSNEFIYRF